MPMPTVMGMPMSMCTGTSTIGKHAARMGWGNFFGKNLLDFGGSRPLPEWFGALFFGDEVPQIARLSAGGRCNSYLGNAQMPSLAISMGLP